LTPSIRISLERGGVYTEPKQIKSGGKKRILREEKEGSTSDRIVAEPPDRLTWMT